MTFSSNFRDKMYMRVITLCSVLESAYISNQELKN